jgi:hypothetical protein
MREQREIPTCPGYRDHLAAEQAGASSGSQTFWGCISGIPANEKAAPVAAEAVLVWLLLSAERK